MRGVAYAGHTASRAASKPVRCAVSFSRPLLLQCIHNGENFKSVTLVRAPLRQRERQIDLSILDMEIKIKQTSLGSREFGAKFGVSKRHAKTPY